jgi:hypothetical protein
MRLGLRAGIAGNDAGGALGEVEDGHQGFGEGRRLVGDHAPFQPARLEFGQQFEDSGEGPRVATDVVGVKLQELRAQRSEAPVVLPQVEADLEQAARAVRGLRPDHFVGQRRQAVALALQVERVAEVGRGVDQGAVEVEQDGRDVLNPQDGSPSGS